MKRKIIFAIATSFFAMATVFNMNMLQSSNASDVSLDNIAVMAQAQDENQAPGYTNGRNTVCDIPSGMCDVGAQDPCQAGYNCD